MSVNPLAYLDLSGSGLAALPDAVGCLWALDALSVRNNRLAALPAAVGELALLRNLFADGNALEALPVELAQLRRLDGADAGPQDEAQPEGDAEGAVVPRERGALGHVGDGREERDAGLGEDAAEGGEGHVDLPHASVTIFIVFAVKISRNRHGCRTLT